MPQTIQQSITLPTCPGELFEMYLDSRIHEQITGAPATISQEPGSEFRAFDGALFGRMLYTVPRRLIVQSWRANHWRAEDIDSILVLTFWPAADSGRIELIHVNVADHDVKDVAEGWEKYYWIPWRRYLQSR